MPDDTPAPHGARPTLSVIVPALNEEGAIGALLRDLAAVEVPHEILVVDGGSGDGTTAVAERAGARVIRSRRGRGVQLAAGARAARGDWLCFLHADVRVPPDARRALARVVTGDTDAGAAFAFRFRIDADGWRFRLIELGTRLRVRLFALPYGDQGLVVRRETYEAAGGYPDVPLMEDVAMVDALRAVTRLQTLPAALPVSPRRWEREGALARTLRNWRLMLAYRLGASPQRLARHYRPHGEAQAAGPADG